MTVEVTQLSWREQKRARLRLDLMRAAVDLITEHGFDGTTVEQIAARAGTSAATFFRYFKVKEDVLFGDTAERLQALRARLAQSDRASDPVLVIEAAMAEQLMNFANFEDEHLERACLEIWASEAGPRRRYMEIVVEWEGVLADHLAERWSLPATHSRCRLTAMVVIAVIRDALEAGAAGRDAARAAIERGYATVNAGLLVRNIDSHSHNP
ncbi:MAG: TetR family transcriptional regulator [Sporichthyaceae bacterium]